MQRRLHLAEEHLDFRHTIYGATGTLTEALQAVPSSLGKRGTTHGSDRTHGRFLIKARRRRVVALAAAAMAAVILVVQGVGVFRSQADVTDQRLLPEASIIPPSISTEPPLPNRPAKRTTRRANTKFIYCGGWRLWRLEMRDIIAEYLDPGGAILPPTSSALKTYATPCGDQTGQSCVSQQFLDGNRFLVTESSGAGQGVEVQYAPYDEVITLTGRERGKGKTLPIDRGQLVELIKDPRLRLPTI